MSELKAAHATLHPAPVASEQNMRLKSVTAEMSHSPMGPYVAAAAAGPFFAEPINPGSSELRLLQRISTTHGCGYKSEVQEPGGGRVLSHASMDVQYSNGRTSESNPTAT